MIVLENHDKGLLNLKHHVFDILCKAVSRSSFNNGNALIYLILCFEINLEFFIVFKRLFGYYTTFVFIDILFSYFASIAYYDKRYFLEGRLLFNAINGHVYDISGWVGLNWTGSNYDCQVRGINCILLIHKRN